MSGYRRLLFFESDEKLFSLLLMDE